MMLSPGVDGLETAAGAAAAAGAARLAGSGVRRAADDRDRGGGVRQVDAAGRLGLRSAVRVAYGHGPRSRLDTLADGVLRALARAGPDLIAGLPVTAWGTGADGAAAEVFSASVCEGMHAGLTHDLVLVLDDVHELGADGGCGEADREPVPPGAGEPARGARLAGRAAVSVESLRRRGEVLELAGDALAFTVDEVAELLGARRCRASLAGRLHAATGGWPVAVGLALEALRRAPAGAARERALAALRRPDGRLFTYLAREVFAREPAGVRELLRRIAPLEQSPAALWEELGPPGTADALAGLLRRGLAVRSGDGSLSLHALLREFVLDSWPLDGAEERDLRRRAAAWLGSRGGHVDALPHLAAASDSAELARVLSRHGAELVAARMRTTRPRGGGCASRPSSVMPRSSRWWARRMRSSASRRRRWTASSARSATARGSRARWAGA